MILQTIKPKTKEDLIIILPEELLNKTVEILIKSRDEKLTSNEEAIKFWHSQNYNSNSYKFDRNEANER